MIHGGAPESKFNTKETLVDIILYLVYNVLTQHDFVYFGHPLTCYSSLGCTEQCIAVQAFIDPLHEVYQENLLVVLEAGCPETVGGRLDVEDVASRYSREWKKLASGQ
jgi:hypothetical protein